MTKGYGHDTPGTDGLYVSRTGRKYVAPVGRKPLPPVLPAGELPPEDSRLWLYPPDAIKLGAKYIRDDTREWFEDRFGTVAISRSYPDHPRWQPGDTRRGHVANDKIAAEVHMLARLAAGLPELPPGAMQKMSVRQLQSDTAWRLLKAAQKVATTRTLEQTFSLLADRQPGQYLKLMAQIAKGSYIPAGVEVPTSAAPDKAEMDAVIEAIAGELKRRADEAHTVKLHPQDYEFTDVVEAVRDTALAIHAHSGPTPDAPIDRGVGVGRKGDADTTLFLGKVVDMQAGDFDDGWD